MTLVTIIMTGYNAGATIERAIRSVLNQTMTDWQLIVVDDGSTDDTADILQRLNAELNDSRFTFLIGEPNVGLPEARNKALDAANSEWVTFLDADDEFTADRLQCAVEAITDDVDIIVSRHTIIDTRGHTQVRGSGHTMTTTGMNHAEWLLIEKATSYVWDKMYRLDSLDGLRFEQVHRAEDKVFNVRAAVRARNVRFIRPAVINYYVSPTSLTWGRVSSTRETADVNHALETASGPLATTGRGRRALRCSKVLAYLAVCHQRVFNGQDAGGLAHNYSWLDAWTSLTMKPSVGTAALLLKLSSRAYARAYRKYWLPRYGL